MARTEAQRGMRTIAAARRKAEAAGNGSGGGNANTAAADAAAAETAPRKKRGRPKKASKAAAAAADTPAERDPLSGAAGAAAPITPDIASSAGASIAASTTTRKPRGGKAAQQAAAADAADTATEPGGTTKRRAEPREEPQLPLPDLDACVPADPEPWAAVERWVVFSDLHVSPRTAGVAVEVLQRVHAEAEARDAGVLFLGDFWHARGSLPVDPLNQVLRVLQGWTRPTLMLVGNHDQVSLGGMSHALTPLAAASPLIHVFDAPAKFLGALWLPYRRDAAETEAAVQAAGPVDAVFGHADVVGAFMNEAYQAQHGLEPELFPQAVPTYLGHYHLPHHVKNSNVRYVGSPYQVSRGETQQEKALLVLEAGSWREIERIPLDVGPRHFLATAAKPLPAASLRPGDKLRWTVPEADLEATEPHIQQLRTEGVEVEVVVPPAAAAPRIADAEELAPLQLFQQYMAARSLAPETVAVGEAILRELPGGLAARPRASTDVQFREVELRGYGPFRDNTTYPLASRSLRCVTGQNEDEAAADSNGAGKSALVMAPLWALTGRSDARSEGGFGRGLTNADVVHDEAAAACVAVRGTVNGQPFLVERTVRRKGRGALKFELDGQDRTGAEMKITQAAIDEAFSTDLLTRAVFFGQTEVNALLEANDADLKNELAKLVNSEAWDAARAVASSRAKAARERRVQLDSELSVRSATADGLRQKVAEAAEAATGWAAGQRRRVQELRSQGDAAAAAQWARLADAQQGAARLRQWLDAVGSTAAHEWLPSETQVDTDLGHDEFAALEQEPTEVPSAAAIAELEAAVAAADAVVPPLEEEVEALQEALQEQRSGFYELRGSLQAAQQRHRKYAALSAGHRNAAAAAVTGNGGLASSHLGDLGQLAADVALEERSGEFAAVCDQCLQPVGEATFHANLHRLQDEVAAAAAAVEASYQAGQRQSDVLAAAQGQLALAQAAAADAAQELQDALDCQAEAARSDERRKQEAVEAQLRARQQKQDAELASVRARERLRSHIHAAQDACRRVAAAAASADTATSTAGSVAEPAAEDAGASGWSFRAGHQRELHEDEVPAAAAAVLASLDASAAAGAEAVAARREAAAAESAPNPAEGRAAEFEVLLAEQRQAIAAATEARGMAEKQGAQAAELEEAFGGGGIKGFLLEGVLGALQERTSRYLEQLCAGTTLALSATQPVVGRGKAAAAAAAEIDKINKTVTVRPPLGANGEVAPARERSVRQLSGGERRRLALALALGFGDLVAQRGRLRCNLIVLDEVLQHLDEEGCSRVAAALRNLPQSSVLVVGQAAGFASRAIDASDVVVKSGGAASIVLGD